MSFTYPRLKIQTYLETFLYYIINISNKKQKIQKIGDSPETFGESVHKAFNAFVVVQHLLVQDREQSHLHDVLFLPVEGVHEAENYEQPEHHPEDDEFDSLHLVVPYLSLLDLLEIGDEFLVVLHRHIILHLLGEC